MIDVLNILQLLHYSIKNSKTNQNDEYSWGGGGGGKGGRGGGVGIDFPTGIKEWKNLRKIMKQLLLIFCKYHMMK